jgi:hypothetical protein
MLKGCVPLEIDKWTGFRDWEPGLDYSRGPRRAVASP